MIWTELDWPALDRLREGFLHGGASKGPYWESETALASYDLTYGERIGWKWDHVLRELQLRSWKPRTRSVLDWGCGSGIAARRVISWFGPENFDTLDVWDHAPIATTFAAEAAAREFPNLRVAQVTSGFLDSEEPIGLLLISHVLNELSPEARDGLLALMRRAESVLWVEPGTRDVSRQLSTHQVALRSSFQIIAPCTHQNACPMLTPDRERDWCHFFAPPPSEIFANPDWVRFGQRAGVDLRSLPYCFLALDRLPPALESGWSRIIGRPEHFKPYARVLNCDAEGLEDLTLPKRADPALFKQLDRTKAPLVYRWRRDATTIQTGEALANSTQQPSENVTQ